MKLLALGATSDLHLFGGQPHQFDVAKSFLDLTQEEAALFFRRTISEPEVIANEFRKAFKALATTMAAHLPTEQVLSYAQHPNPPYHEKEGVVHQRCQLPGKTVKKKKRSLAIAA